MQEEVEWKSKKWSKTFIKIYQFFRQSWTKDNETPKKSPLPPKQCCLCATNYQYTM